MHTAKDFLLNEGVVPLFVDHFLHRLVEWIDPLLATVIAQSWCSSNSIFSYPSYTSIMNDGNGVILNLVPHMIYRF